MVGFGGLMSVLSRKGDGATYGKDYVIGAAYELAGKKNYSSQEKFSLGFAGLHRLYSDYASITESFKSVRNVEVLVEPRSPGFDPSLLRRKLDAAVGRIASEKRGVCYMIDMLASNQLMRDSPLLKEYVLRDQGYNRAIKGAGLIYGWLDRHERSSSSLKA